jgi:WD40 repeat protein
MRKTLLGCLVVMAAGSGFAEEVRGRALPIKGHLGSFALSPDGALLATVTHDGTVQLWDVATAAPAARPLEGVPSFKANFSSGTPGGEITFSPDGKSLAWRCDDKAVLWDVETRQPIGHFEGAPGKMFKGVPAASTLGFAADSQTMVVQTREGLVFWNIPRRAPVGPPVKGLDWMRTWFTPDGRRVVSITGDSEVRLWDIATAEAIGPPLQPPAVPLRGKVWGPKFSRDGHLLATVADEEVVLWDLATRQMTARLTRDAVGLPREGHGGVAFSPDGRRLTWGAGSAVAVWDVAEGKLGFVARSGGDVRSIAFSPDGRTLALGTGTFAVSLWDLTTGREAGPAFLVGEDVAHAGRERAGAWELQFSPDGSLLEVETSMPVVLELWDVTRRPAQRLSRSTDLQRLKMMAGPGYFESLRKPMGIPSWGPDAVQSPDGKVVAYRTGNSLWLMDVSRRDSIPRPAVVPLSAGDVIAFGQDGRTLVVYDDRKSGPTFTLWDVEALLSPRNDAVLTP